ncbi:DUF6182 family protein [Bradyrhizobium sp. SZCCHNG3015]
MKTEFLSPITAFAVMNDFKPSRFAECCIAFALSLDRSSQARWFNAYTRTIFFAGNPRNLSTRLSYTYLSNDGSIGLIAPGSKMAAGTLRHLLRPFHVGPPHNGSCDFTLNVPGAGAGSLWTIFISVSGLTGSQYLIHLNHILAEGLFVGTIQPGDTLRVCSVPSLTGAEPGLVLLRVHVDQQHRDRLKCYAAIGRPDASV